MSLYLINVLANSIYICKNNGHSVLEYLLFRYAKKKLSCNQLIVVCIKLAGNIDENTQLYKFLSIWINIHNIKIVRQLLYYDYDT